MPRRCAQRTGRGIAITAVCDRFRRDRGFSTDGYAWYDDAVAMARDADVDVVVELIGGAEGAAKAVCEAAIARGRHVVTANKALIAHHGMALAAAAEAQRRRLWPTRRRSPAASRSSSRCARA